MIRLLDDALRGVGRHVLFVRASFHGIVVEERYVGTGLPITIGGPNANPGRSSVAIPVPEGVDHAARIVWTTPSTCVVTDAFGQRHELAVGKDLVLQLGEVELKLYLVERVFLARVGTIATAGALAWFTLVVMFSTGAVQGAWLSSLERRCALGGLLLPRLEDVGGPILWALAPILGLFAALFVLVMADQPRRAVGVLGLPLVALIVPLTYELSGYRWMSGTEYFVTNMTECMAQPGGAGASGIPISAEYLARLLRKDYDGEQVGVVEDRIDRPRAERETDQLFMPAGHTGPATKMGGADEVAPKPIRTIVEDEPSVTAKAESADQATPRAEGRPLAESERERQQKQGTENGFDDVQPDEQRDIAEAPAEEVRGWGFPEWYDERDKAMDDLEVGIALRAARSRLAIDPNDGAALSILSYYQYLAQDYDGARKTYDRYIELFPDDAAGYNNKALIYKRQGEYQKEESLYRVALSLSPDDPTALNNLGVNLAHQKRFDEALEVMRGLEVTDPFDAYADLHRSKIYAEMGKNDESLRYLEKALEGMSRLDTLHHIEFRQDIRLDPSFEELRDTYRFRAMLNRYYGKDSPLEE